MGKPDRHQTGCVVIGAGVVGLACARALARAGQDVVLLERHAAIGAETSSRNSEVIHAGLYYAPGSLKARFCVDGKHRLYAYCAERGVAHRRCGKLIVAITPGKAAKLEGVKARAEANGVHDLQLLSGAEAMALEPALSCSGAALSPSTGIVDSHGLMTSLLGDFEDAGGLYARTSAVVGGRRMARGGELIIQSEGDADIARLSAPLIVNAAGLEASRLLAAIDGFPPALVPPLRLAKGQYFAYRGRAPFQRLIYPLPVDGGLGVHVTLDLAGAARLGPDVIWDAALGDYAVAPEAAAAFFEAARAYWPSLDKDRLYPDYAGLRPKLSGPGEPPADFRIDGPDAPGAAGWINLFGIESPGLTAALAIGAHVAALASAAR